MDIPGYDVLQEFVRHGPYAVYRGRRRSNQHPVLIKASERVPPHRADSEALERQFDLDRNNVQLLNIGFVAGLSVEAGARTSGRGTAYKSPEQTGRMNRATDYRTDFYSLGITLYELLTGAPPFTSDDSLELIHAHIAKIPTPPTQLDAAIPGQLSRIVGKLLAKAAEDRYQSALGLKHDVDRCQHEWTADRTISLFDLGQQDVLDSRSGIITGILVYLPLSFCSPF